MLTASPKCIMKSIKKNISWVKVEEIIEEWREGKTSDNLAEFMLYVEIVDGRATYNTHSAMYKGKTPLLHKLSKQF